MAETRTIRTVLELNAQRFNRGAASAAASAKTLSGELARIGDSNGQFRAEYDRVGNSLLGMGAAAAAGLGLATKASMDWESAWAGVLKTVDGSPEELAALEEGLRGLTKELPATHAEIAGVAEAAGQLGVAQEDVVDFTRTMINLGETTNLSADEAATGLARFSNIMGTSQDEVDNLGAAIVGLGNNYATTEAEILAMSMRLAGTGAQMGLTEGDVLGLAAAMSSVGIEAEAGGTAMSMGMRKIDAAVREGGESLAGFAEVAGMTNEEFSKLWSTDSAEGLDVFVQGLSRISEEGGDVSGVLSELGIKGIRESDTFLRLAGAADILSEALESGNTEFERNLALTEEAAKRYETTASQLQIARNQLVDAGIDIGAQVLPVLADAAGHVADLAGWFSELPDPVQSSVVQLGAAAGASALLAGGLMKAVPAAMDTVQAFKRIRTEAPGVTSALGKVGKAVGIAAVAFGTASAVAAYGDSLSDVGLQAEEAAAAAMKLAGAKDPVQTLFAGMDTGSQAASASAQDLAADLDILANGHWYEGISNFETNFRNAFGAGLETTDDIRQRIDEIGKGLAGLTQTDLPQAQAGFAGLMEAFGGTDEAGLNLLELMPALKNEMAGLANQAGLDATDQMVLLKLATGELVPEMQGAEGAAGEFGGAVNDATGEVEEQVDALDELQGRLKTTSDLLLGTRGSELDFLDSIDAATDALDENGKVLDENGNLLNEMDEDARASRRALDGIAESTHAWIDALPDNATAEELDAVMERGRAQFIKSAEDMGMSEEAAADLADQLGLMPEFVETEVKVETEKAKADWAALWDELGYHPPEVPVDADTDPAKQSIGGLMHQPPVDVPVDADTSGAESDVDGFTAGVESGTSAEVPVGADVEPAVWEVNALEAAINDAGGTVTINGNEVPADQVLGTLMGEINESDGTVTINGMSVPAELALSQAIGLINASGGTVTIEGNNKPAKSETDEAKAHADGTTGTIDVDADTADAEGDINRTARNRGSYIDVDHNASSANSSINSAARDRSSRIYVRYSVVGGTPQVNFGTGRVATGRAAGGWLNAGLSDGGWVPGSYPGPGIDNVMWPMAGKAGGGMLTQPLAGTEYVVNGQSAQQWGPALEAINSGVSRSELAAMVGGGGSSVAQVDQAGIQAAVQAGLQSATLVAQVSDRVAANLYQRGKSGSRAYGGGR